MRKVYLCVDCDKRCQHQAKRCRECNAIYTKKMGTFKGKNNGNFKDGKTIKKNYCIDCKKQIDYKNERCWKCECKRRKISYKGKGNSFFNREHRKESKKKISLSKGGTGIPYEFNNYPKDFFRIKPKIRARDNYTCQLCDKKFDKYSTGLDVHHIDYNKNNNDEINLICLCHKCNIRANFDRDYCYAYYTYKMEEKHNDKTPCLL